MASILVVDDSPIIREPLARVFKLLGHDATASSAIDAFTLISTAPPHLVLLDLFSTRGDGMALLRRIRADVRLKDISVIVITAAAGRDQLIAARSMGVREYLLKSQFSLDELLSRVDRQLAPMVHVPPTAPPPTAPAAGPAPSLAPANTSAAPPATPPEGKLDAERCLVRIRHMLSEKAPSPVTAQVIGMAASPTLDMDELTEVIATDPMLSSRVIQAANSAAYGPSRKPVATVPEAVRKIGFAAVRNIAVASGMVELVPSGRGFNPVRSWQHSLAVAKLAESLVAISDAPSASLAYVAGLCHELGSILFHVLFADEDRRVTEAHGRTGAPIEELEASTFGMTVADLVNLIGRNLGLPETVVAPIEAMNRLAAPLTPIVHALRMSDAYANGLFLASDASARVIAYTRAHCKSAGLGEEPPIPEPQAFRNEIRSLTASLARGTDQERAQALESLIAKQEVPIWLSRDPGISPFDPISMAFAAIADVKASDRLPDDAELSDCAGLVVIYSGVGKGFELSAVERLVKARRTPMLYWSATTERTTTPAGIQTVHGRVPLERLGRFAESCRAGMGTVPQAA